MLHYIVSSRTEREGEREREREQIYECTVVMGYSDK